MCCDEMEVCSYLLESRILKGSVADAKASLF